MNGITNVKLNVNIEGLSDVDKEQLTMIFENDARHLYGYLVQRYGKDFADNFEINVGGEIINPQSTVTVDPSTSTQNITPSAGYNCLSEVVVNAASLQQKTVTPTEVSQEIVPDEGYIGLSKVIVEAIPEEG